MKLSEIISHGNRLEAAVFDIDAMNARQLVINGKFPATAINNLATAYYPERFKRIYCEKKYGEPFYLPAQIKDVYPKAEKFISRATPYNLDELYLKNGTVILTRSGTIGSVAFVSKTLAGKIFSDDIIRLTCKKNFDAGYIYAYLKSKVGNEILLTNSYGAVITHIEPEHLEKVPIPDAPENLKRHIHELIVKSYDLRDESNLLIDEATQILIDELHLPPIEDFETQKNFSVKLSDLRGRLDASFHLPIVEKIILHLKNYAAEVTTIGDNRISKDIILPGRFKRVYVDKNHGRIFIGGKQIGELDPSNKKYLSNVHHADRISEQLELHENMTLITRSGTIGNIALVPKHWDECIASEHIIRVIPASVDIAGYINIFLASDYGRELIRRNTYGAVVDEIDDNHVRAVAIPILKNVSAQKKINALALSANEKRFEAYELEQAALKIFDEEIF